MNFAVYVVTPALSHVAAVLTALVTSVVSVTVIFLSVSQTAFAVQLLPSSDHVYTGLPYLCSPVAGITFVSVAPSSSQVLTARPDSVHVAGTLVTHSPQL